MLYVFGVSIIELPVVQTSHGKVIEEYTYCKLIYEYIKYNNPRMEK